MGSMSERELGGETTTYVAWVVKTGESVDKSGRDRDKNWIPHLTSLTSLGSQNLMFDDVEFVLISSPSLVTS